MLVAVRDLLRSVTKHFEVRNGRLELPHGIGDGPRIAGDLRAGLFGEFLVGLPRLRVGGVEELDGGTGALLETRAQRLIDALLVGCLHLGARIRIVDGALELALELIGHRGDFRRYRGGPVGVALELIVDRADELAQLACLAREGFGLFDHLVGDETVEWFDGRVELVDPVGDLLAAVGEFLQIGEVHLGGVHARDDLVQPVLELPDSPDDLGGSVGVGTDTGQELIRAADELLHAAAECGHLARHLLDTSVELACTIGELFGARGEFVRSIGNLAAAAAQWP